MTNRNALFHHPKRAARNFLRALQKTFVFGVAFTFATSPTLAYADTGYFVYRVQPNESLSHILYDRFEMTPVYGPHGYINQVIRLNTGRILNSGDLIQAGELLMIPILTAAAKNYDAQKNGRKIASTVEIAVTSAQPTTQAQAQALAQDSAPFAAPTPVPVPAPVPTLVPLTVAIVTPAATPAPPPVSTPVAAAVPAVETTPAHAPKAALAPTPTAVRPPPMNEFEPFSKVQFALGLNYSGLFGVQTSNQTSGQLLTGLSPHGELSWNQVWDESSTTRLFLTGENLNFEPDHLGQHIGRASIFDTSIGFGYRQQLGSRLAGAVDVEVAQTPFYQGVVGGGVEISQVPLLHVHPTIEFALLKRRPFTLSALAGYSYFGASSYDNYSVQSGSGFDGGINIAQDFARSRFECKMTYAERHQNTTYLNLVQKSVGAVCGLAWGL